MNGRNMIKLTVTTAKPLTDREKASLNKKFTVKYGEFTVEYLVDYSLIGGIKIFDGLRVFDGSVSGQLERLKKNVKGK